MGDDVGVYFHAVSVGDMDYIFELFAAGQESGEQVFLLLYAVGVEGYILVPVENGHIENLRFHDVLEEMASVGQFRHKAFLFGSVFAQNLHVG